MHNYHYRRAYVEVAPRLGIERPGIYVTSEDRTFNNIELLITSNGQG
jgi:hypothetical protein